jgi:hypothetical protein
LFLPGRLKSLELNLAFTMMKRELESVDDDDEDEDEEK